jgi:hypothetical protein
MKRTAVLLLAAVAVAAQAQSGAPSDVPRNHWAFEAVDTLFREGLLKGYPDGTFKGSRPLSRYELAAVLDGVNRKLQARLDAIQAGKAQASPIERAELEAQIRALRGDVDELKPIRSELNSLTERLALMQGDLANIRKDLSEMSRQTELVKAKK